MLEQALNLAGRNWRVFPAHTTINGTCSCGRACGKDAGKHPRIKAWQKVATTDPAQIVAWWTKWPDANIAVATGQGLVVVDVDGAKDMATLAKLPERLPETLTSKTGRGFHCWFLGDIGSSKTVEGLLVRGDGGYVIAPQSLHASGVRYQWVLDVLPAPFPEFLSRWLQTAANTKEKPTTQSPLGPRPAYLDQTPPKTFKTPHNPLDEQRIISALQAIPASCARDPWLHIGMSLHDWNPERGFLLWNSWSKNCDEKYSLPDVETRWRSFGKPGRGGITLGSLFHIAEQHGWTGNLPREIREEVIPHSANRAAENNEQPHSAMFAQGGAVDLKVNGTHAGPALLPTAFTHPTHDSPLIELNEKYAVIGDVGSKCLVMGWVPSKIDNGLSVPSFQNFQAFTQRYANRYVTVRKPKGEDVVEEPVQLGAHWLKWKQRRTFEGIDLVPGSEAVLPGNVLNLWHGFGVEPKEGDWPLMKAHIANVLANGNVEAMQYIMRWTAWTVQNPGERAEAALVFRGGKGSGKGIFANALRSIFGSHGLSVSNSKHLVGAFNGHLRNCLLLFADEAFWAGDKQGESVLKAILTEPLLTIEQKGIDAAPWKNRLHMIMAANADWVVPASHDERRFAMFDCSNERIGDESYFKELHREMKEGGLAAMLHDLLALDLKGWHPRRVPATEALQSQKQRSLDVLHDWFEGLLQDGILPAIGAKGDPLNLPAAHLLHTAKEASPKLRDVSGTAMGRFLRKMGCIKMRNATHNSWKFPGLAEARARWVQQYGRWTWEANVEEWQSRN